MTLEQELESPERTRDLRRAHWQRSVGVVLMNELVGDDMPDAAAGMTHKSLEWIEHQSNAVYTEDPMKKLWMRAHTASEWAINHVFRVRAGRMYRSLPDSIGRDFKRYTHYGDFDRVIDEGLRAQQHFPINLAHSLARQAACAGIVELNVQSLADVAGILRRPDFHRMVDDSAFTRNGVWRSYSTAKDADEDFHPDKIRNLFDLSDAPEELRLSPVLKTYLRSRIADVNSLGYAPSRSTLGVEQLASSGCPARHLRAHFTDSLDDRSQLAVLSQYLKKPVEELTAAQEQNLISKCLDLSADAIEKAGVLYDADVLMFNREAAR